MSVKKYIMFCLVLFVPLYTKQKIFTIMLDPAGDAQHAGRKIGDYTERGATLQFGNALKKNIEESHSGIRVVLTRFPGETIQPRQNASFANRLDVDLYLSIHFFKQTTRKSLLHLFFFCLHPTTDFWSPQTPNLAFVKSSEIHKQSIKTSKAWAQTLFESMHDHSKSFDTPKPLGIPFKPLYGLKAPSIGIEASLTYPEEWQQYVQAITDGISTLITKTKKESSRGIFS